MKSHALRICLILAITATYFTTLEAQVNVNDSLALVNLYKSTGGPNWYNHTNWLTKAPVSTWYGVQVSAGSVTMLDLQINGLSGVIPSAIGNLDNLTHLNLQSNRLHSTIPTTIGNLQKLTYLNIGYCDLTGAIPAEIGNLTSMDSLILAYNRLSGSIPTEIGNAVNLKYVLLTNNQLSGSIPVSIGNLVNLTFLNLNINQLSGAIPASIGNLTNLNSLLLFSNQLSGSIPATVGNLVNLSYLYLFNNRLSGSIPATIGNLTKLIDLQLNDNKLSGTIPGNIGNLTQLSFLNLNNNKLTGGIPATIGNLKQLKELLIHANSLNDTLPSSLGNLAKIESMDLAYNQLPGAIPTSLHKLPPTAFINLSYNQLTQFGERYAAINTNNIRGNISNNLLTFDGLQVLAKYLPKVVYAPQNTILPIQQNSNVLSVAAGGVVSNNTYTWHKAGTTDSTVIEKDSAFMPSANGKYYVTVQNKIAKKLTLYSDTIDFVMSAIKQSLITKRAQPAASIKQLRVYPNPASNSIRLQTDGAATINLTNSTGITLLTKTINNKGEINVSKYANGTYYIKNKTTGVTQKIIIVH